MGPLGTHGGIVPQASECLVNHDESRPQEAPIVRWECLGASHLESQRTISTTRTDPTYWGSRWCLLVIKDCMRYRSHEVLSSILSPLSNSRGRQGIEMVCCDENMELHPQVISGHSSSSESCAQRDDNYQLAQYILETYPLGLLPLSDACPGCVSSPNTIV